MKQKDMELINSEVESKEQQNIKNPFYYKLINAQKNLVVIIGNGVRVTHPDLSQKMQYKEINSY